MVQYLTDLPTAPYWGGILASVCGSLVQWESLVHSYRIQLLRIG